MTEHAPATRADDSTLRADAQRVRSDGFIASLLDAVDAMVFVLNHHRQVVHANARVLELLGICDPGQLLGLRPGETVRCENAYRCAGGCGTSSYCITCGGVNSILSGIEGKVGLGECRILTLDGNAFDLLVRATPVEIHGSSLVLLSATDISHRKRRQILERVFFHDVMNTVSGLRLLSEKLDTDPKISQTAAEGIHKGLEMLMAELAGQRDLSAAEEGELEIEPTPLRSRGFLESVLKLAGSYQSLSGCEVVVSSQSRDISFVSDPTILSRVLCNLVKNAVEASQPGQTVTLGAFEENDGVRFDVHNESVMDPEVQRQLFRRSFSTKGDRRGLGTYSVRLLTEKYLSGLVRFKSGKEIGTVFSVWCPNRVPEARS
jgi:signal transduction histidine kinase